jgi:low temperature requirement protein LtrA
VTRPAKASLAEAQQIATNAYIYGHSPIAAPVTLVQTSNAPKAEGLRTPLNQFVNVPRYGGAPSRAG